MIFADKILALRKKRGWSQEELAEKMNVSRQAVSKWESAQSTPDIEKILMLSRLFEVSTDYLLKDEIESEEQSFKPKKNVNARIVTTKEANQYISFRKKASILMGVGIFLFIISPSVLAILLTSYTDIGITMLEAIMTGVIVILLLVTVGAVMTVYCSFKNAAFGYLSEEFVTEQGVEDMVKEKNKHFTSFGIASNLVGTCLCVLSPVPILLSVFMGGYVIGIGITAMLFMLGTGVMLFIIGTVQSNSMNKLLSDKNIVAEENKKKRTLSAAYWIATTAIYFTITFVSNSWLYSWIVWPIACMFYPLIFFIRSKFF